MELSNYKLRSEGGVELIGHGHNWDLHNFASCVDRSFDPNEGTAAITWRADTPENPWGDPSNTAAGCILRFKGVTRWEVEQGSGPDAEVLNCIGCSPLDESDLGEADDFSMWIAFDDGSMVKVKAKSSELVPW